MISIRGFIPFLACLGIALVSADGETTSSFNFDFTKLSEITGWQKTGTIEATASAQGVTLKAENWDAKIYRTLKLQAGRYVLYGRASGKINILILKDFNSPALFHLNLTSGEPATDYVDFTIPPGADASVILCVSLPGPHDTASLQWLRIEKPPAETGTDAIPNPEELGKFKPMPPVVRGFMVGGDWSEKTFKDMSSWGANVVRLQLDPVNLAKPFKLPFWDAWPQVLDEIEQAVKNANKYGIKVVVDLHVPPMPKIMEKSEFDKPELWHDPELDSSFLRFWTDVAKRLKPYNKGIWGYDLLNEPLDRSQLPWEPKQWRPLAVNLLKAIRAVDPDVWIIYEPGPGSLDRGFDGLVPLPDTHVIYSVHSYYPGEFTGQGLDYVGGFDRTDLSKKKDVHYPSKINGVYYDKSEIEKALAPAIDFAKKWHVPMYVGEFSVIRWAPKADAVQWLKDSVDIFEQLGWSWSYHAFREFNGWSLENDETFWHEGMPVPQPVNYITERGKVIRKAMEANKVEADAATK
jgi:endoglucanase